MTRKSVLKLEIQLSFRAVGQKHGRVADIPDRYLFSAVRFAVVSTFKPALWYLYYVHAVFHSLLPWSGGTSSARPKTNTTDTKPAEQKIVLTRCEQEKDTALVYKPRKAWNKKPKSTNKQINKPNIRKYMPNCPCMESSLWYIFKWSAPKQFLRLRLRLLLSCFFPATFNCSDVIISFFFFTLPNFKPILCI